VVAHRRGIVADAIQASMSLPGVFPAWVTDQRLLVDGGVLNNLPIDVMASDGGGRIIAVDVMSRGGRNSVFESHTRYHKRAPTTLETLARAATLGSWRWTAGHRLLADVLIAPDAQAIGLLDFDQIDRAVAAGRYAAQSTLAKSPTSTDG
jgi:NTE family protein